MAYEVSVGGARVEAEITELEEGRYEVTLDGHKSIIDARFPEQGVLHLIRDGEAFEFDHSPTADGHEVTLYGTRYLVDVIDERRKVLRSLGRGGADSGSQVLSTSTNASREFYQLKRHRDACAAKPCRRPLRGGLSKPERVSRAVSVYPGCAADHVSGPPVDYASVRRLWGC